MVFHASVTDEDLLARIKRTQDHAAFNELVKRHAARYRQLAYRFTHSVADAEDIVQEAFTALWIKPEQWNVLRNTRFTTWFYRIIVNRCVDYTRRKKPVAMPEDMEFEDAAVPVDEVMIRTEQEVAVEAAFRTLSPDMQTALNLSFYEPVPNREAADIMGMSLKAFQSLLMRAKTALRDKVLHATQQTWSERYG